MPDLDALRETGVRPNRLRDTVWLERFLASGSRCGEPLLLGLGETWQDTPKELVQALADVPASCHGYQLSMYGLPRLRQVLKSYVSRTQRLDPLQGAFEVATTWTGTRSAMGYYGELLRDRRDGPLVATAVSPSWDYAGVFEPLGFRMQYLDMSRSGWRLSPKAVASFVASAEHTDLLVLNPQHNPTGESWSPSTVDALLDIARQDRSAILVDDAYYGFADAVGDRASATEQILADGALRESTWLAVRSLGKQFHCNGWGVGAVTGPPALLDDFVNDYRARREFNTGAMQQYAMARWLEDEDAVDGYLRSEQQTYASRRAALIDTLAGAGFQRDDIIAGPSNPYALIPIPAGFRGRSGEYLEACAVQAGVLLSSVWPADRALDGERPGEGDYVRLFLGVGEPGLVDAVRRLEACGLTPR